MKKQLWIALSGFLVLNYSMSPVAATPVQHFNESLLRIGGMWVGGCAGSIAGMACLTGMACLMGPHNMRGILEGVESLVLFGGATFAGAVLGGGLLVSPVHEQSAVLAGALAGSVLSHAWLLYVMRNAGSGGLAYFIYEPVITPVVTTLAAVAGAYLANAL